MPSPNAVLHVEYFKQDRHLDPFDKRLAELSFPWGTMPTLKIQKATAANLSACYLNNESLFYFATSYCWLTLTQVHCLADVFHQCSWHGKNGDLSTLTAQCMPYMHQAMIQGIFNAPKTPDSPALQMFPLFSKMSLQVLMWEMRYAYNLIWSSIHFGDLIP